MPRYVRARIAGGTWFFTVNLLRRHGNDLLIREVDRLRLVTQAVRRNHPFKVDAWVFLPDHMDCIWTLPPDDADLSMRWRLIKTLFSRALPKSERRSAVRAAAGEPGIW